MEKLKTKSLAAASFVGQLSGVHSF